MPGLQRMFNKNKEKGGKKLACTEGSDPWPGYRHLAGSGLITEDE